MKQFLLLLSLLFLIGCSTVNTPPEERASSLSPSGSEEEAIPSACLPDPYPEPAPDDRQMVINAIFSAMTEEEKVGQLFFARCPAKNGAALAAEYHLGGYILFGRDFKGAIGNWLTEEQFIKTVQSYQDAVSIPMLIGVDEEGGTVVRASRNPNLFDEPCKSPQWLDKHQSTAYDVFASDIWEKNNNLQRFGINVNFAPVCDVSTDPNSFIYDRTLGKNAAATAEYVAAVIKGSNGAQIGIGTVMKHFPGYGDNADTHVGIAIDERPIETFRTSDFLPFQAGIEVSDGTTAVLVSHNTVLCMDSDRPASLSPAVYQILREELDFDGPALTDDLAMEAIVLYAKSQKQSPAVLALAAGCDMVVTTDFQTQVAQVLSALESGTLSQERVDEAVRRVLGWKYDLGLLK